MSTLRRRPAGWGRCALCLCACVTAPLSAQAGDEHPLLSLMQSELNLSMEKLEGPGGIKPYFLQYTITDERSVSVAASLGSITSQRTNHSRLLDVDVRCGDYALDNTHQIRGGYVGGYDWGGGWTPLPLDGNPVATRHAIWLATDERFKDAAQRLAEVQANVKIKVDEEDQSDDFTREEPSGHVAPWAEFAYSEDVLARRVREYSRRFRQHPLIYNSSVSVHGSVENQVAVNSEGSRIQTGESRWRIGIRASTIADDGMQLWQYKSFDAHSLDGLPDHETILRGVDEVIADVLALREAPIVDPYTGPAILLNRASGVFFHEIFGHRIEGHRQKDVEEGQTFAKKLGEPVLPPFLSVVDDPSQRVFGGTELNGHYEFDAECVPAQPARLVEEGVLKSFLMCRSPARGINKSNGHGRRAPGYRVVARQGNLFIQSTRQVPLEQLRAMLIEECRKQSKEYGLFFKDISGGFTTTRRGGPQAFKVLPILVYRVYADGRPDELVRGVDIVGTPLTCFSKILCTADDDGVFNGTCGAESGGVPVAAVSPSILVEQIEVEKKQKAQDRPPILVAPIADEKNRA